MIYFDSAATSFQKPASVGRAMQNALQTMSSPGRGGYPAAMYAAETALHCRMEIQELFHAEVPEQVVFTLNATHALNIAIKSLVRPGSRVVISGYEHNAVTRPLSAIQNVEITVASSELFRPEQCADSFEKALENGQDVAVCSHVSNVFGYVQPIEEIALQCKKHRIPLIVDASQSAGILPIDLQELGAAFIAMPGHKGLYGPQGTGVLLCGNGIRPETLLEGGTGSVSAQQEMPEFLPDRLEAGTHNMPGIAGLLEGVRFVKAQGPETIRKEECALMDIAAHGLRKIPGIHVFSDNPLRAQTGVLSFLHEKIDSERLGDLLGSRQIAVRSGLHCAPLAHQSVGTLKTGTVRISFSAFNNRREVLQFLRVLQQISGENS